jgi:hypothetical protein
VRLYLYYIAWGVFGLTLPLIFIKSKKRLVLLTTAICFALIILLSLGFVIGPKYRLFNPDKFMEDAYITNHKILLQRGSVYHIYDDDFRISGLKKLKFIKAYLKGFFYFLFSPLPWQLYSARIMFIYPVVLIWHLIAPFSLCGIIFSLRHKFRYAFPVVAYIFLVTSAFGLVEGNIGATMRHRDLVLPFFFMLSIAGIVFVFNRKILYEKA